MLNQKMPVIEGPSPNLFWGIVLKSDKRYEQTVEESFHISKACIEPNPTNGKICTVYLEQDNEEFILCNLSMKNLNESLDLNFQETEKICFRVEGGGTVHLTGYLVPEEDEQMYPMEDMSDEEEEDDEEVPPMLVKKRKLENGASPKGEKKTRKEDEIKQAQALKKILEKKGAKESEDEDSSDDDSDDDDMDESEVTDGSSLFDSTAADDDEDESGEDEDGSEEDDEEDESSDDDSEENTPAKKAIQNSPGDKTKETPKSKGQQNATPKSVKKEKIETPKSVKKETKVETPMPKKENKPENKGDTPATKKDKKNQQLPNGGTPKQVNGTQTPKNESKTPSKNNEGGQTPKNKDAKTPSKDKDAKAPSKDKQSAQTPNKTPKKTLKGGLMVEDLQVGTGPEAKAGKVIGMYYDGKLKSNNKQFDAQKQGKPFKFRLGRGEVIKGWDMGVEGMKVGGKRRLTVPAPLAYGSQGAPPDIPPNATLVFDVECKLVN